MENITSLQVKNALERAKVDKSYGAELQKRLETGKYDSQLSELGIVRSPQGLKRISSETQQTTQEPSFSENIASDISQRGQNIADIQQAREQGKSATMEALKIVSPELAAKVEPALSVAQKIKSKLGVGLDVAKAGQVAGAVDDTLGNILMSIPGVEKVTSLIGKEIGKVVPDVLAKAGVNTIEEYNAFAEQNPMIAKNLEGAVNIASLLPVGGAAKVGVETVEQGTKAAGKQAAKVAGEVATQAGKAGAKVGEMTGGAGNIVRDIVPTSREFMSGQISKALDLTAGDLSNIKLATGNDVGDFIARNNLIGASKDDTIKAVKSLTDSQYKLVRDEIAKVKNSYSINEIPKVKQSLSLLEEQVKDVPGLEDTYKQVKELSKKTNVELKDVQKVKELLDDQFSLFKATGDVKEGTIKKGLANVRKNIKEFIENEVKDTTGADIAQLNNDVSTGKSIMQLANKRSTRDFTRANVSLSDLGAFGTGSMVGTPLVGAAAIAVKRIVETPTVRLQLAKILNSLPKTTQKAVQKELLNGKVPKVIDDVVKDYRLATNIKNSSTASAKNASIPKASTKSATKSKDLSTDLVSEAKKYKSAEEFVKAQGTPVYHGTKGSVDIKNISAQPESRGQYLGNGIYFTKYKEGAELYGGKILDAVVNEKDFLDISKLQGVNRTKEIGSFGTYKQYLKNNSLEDTTTNFKKWQKNQQEVADKILEMGYKGVTDGQQHVIFDKSTLKTKSQLTDIYNKANKKVTLPKKK